MYSKSLFYLLICFCLVSSTFTLQAQSKAQQKPSNTSKDTLIVGVAGSAPFVIKSNNAQNPEGIAVEIWEDLADEEGWAYRYKSFGSVGTALNALDSGGVDMVVGPVSITADRLKNMSFSQPYYQSSLAIASRADQAGLWGRIKPLFSFKLLIAVGVFLIILAIVGTLLWLAERRASDEQFPSRPINGIGNGMWLAIVTMTTVGYGDKAPVTLWGRIIAGSWMVISIIFATSMVAGIASTLTLSTLGASTITNVEQLSGKTTATVAGSPANVFLKENKAKAVGVDNLDEAMSQLKNKKVDAVVYDRPQLLYYLRNHDSEKLHISSAEYYKQGYGFAFPINSDLVTQVNRTLLQLAENHTVKKITDDYLGKEE